MGMINTPNALNGDLGHLSPALVEGKGVALSAEARREPAERITPQLAEKIYLVQ